MEVTLGESFARSARKYPNKIAVMDDEGRMPYDQLNRRVNRWVHALTGIGLQKGTKVATLSNNCIRLMEVFLGNLKAGVVTVPLNSRGTLADIAFQITKTDTEMIVFEKSYAGMAEALHEKLPHIRRYVCLGEKGVSFAIDYDELLSNSSEAEPEISLVEEDEAVIMFTGGTTGTPKGAVLTHKNLLWNIICTTTENQTPAPEETTLYPMQIYHIAAYSRFLGFMYAGGTFIAIKEFEADRILDMVEQERVTFMVGNPTIYRGLLEANRKKKRNTSSLKRWICTQGFLHENLKDQLEADLWLPGGMYGSYALTESSPAVTVLKPWDTPREWGSVGRPYMAIDVRIVDEEDRDVAVGAEGEIIVRGPTVFKEYYKEPEETARTLRNGWLHTGDMGKYDDLGYLYMVDRVKDMIKTGGLNVYSREVEEVLSYHPGIAEAVIIGLPDEKWGEAVCAVVVPRKGAELTAESVINHCRDRLSHYKKPASVIFVDELPKGTFGGKILKRVLREKYGKMSV